MTHFLWLLLRNFSKFFCFSIFQLSDFFFSYSANDFFCQNLYFSFGSLPTNLVFDPFHTFSQHLTFDLSDPKVRLHFSKIVLLSLSLLLILSITKIKQILQIKQKIWEDLRKVIGSSRVSRVWEKQLGSFKLKNRKFFFLKNHCRVSHSKSTIFLCFTSPYFLIK